MCNMWFIVEPFKTEEITSSSVCAGRGRRPKLADSQRGRFNRGFKQKKKIRIFFHTMDKQDNSGLVFVSLLAHTGSRWVRDAPELRFA